jgi:hypothetical protein
MAARPIGHHVFMTTRVDGIGGNAPQFHSSANGMTLTPSVDSTLLHSADPEIPDYQHPHASVHHHDNGRLPKLNFPFYEGDTTRLWISQAEDYFEMYDVPPHRWVKVSCMHFKGTAARWIESLEQPDKIPWPDFCKLLHDRFGHDQRDWLSRQMFHIHQTSTVLDYGERFSTLFDQLKAYQPNPDFHYYTTCFVDGLRHDIRMVVALQHPSDLDTAYSLALLQEEMADSSKKSEFHAYDRGASFKVAQKAAHPTRLRSSLGTSRWPNRVFRSPKKSLQIFMRSEELGASVTYARRSGSRVTSVPPLFHYKQCKKCGIYSRLKICLTELISSRTHRWKHQNNSFWPCQWMHCGDHQADRLFSSRDKCTANL